MEAPQRRRRPVATYGKSVKKRYPSFGGVVPSPPKLREELLGEQRAAFETVKASTALVGTVQTQENESQTIKPSRSTTGGGANMPLKPAEKRSQVGLKGKNKRPSSASAVTSPPKHLKGFDLHSSDDDNNDDIVQPQLAPKSNDEFDVPSSDEELVLAEKRAPPRKSSQAPISSADMRRFTKEVKLGAVGPSTRDSKLARNGPPPKKQEKQVSIEKNIAKTSRAVKVPSSKPSKVSEVSRPKIPKISTITPPELPQKITTNPSISLRTTESGKPVSRKSQSTCSQSMQLSVRPEALGERQIDQKNSHTKSVQTNPQTCYRTEPVKSHKSVAVNRIKTAIPTPLPLVLGESSSLPLHQSSPQGTHRDTVSCSPGIIFHVEELSGKCKEPDKEPRRVRGNIPRMSEIFQNVVEESAPHRRRLIDRLGTGASQSDFMEPFSSDSSDESEEESIESQAHSISDSQVVDATTGEQPQELITEPLVKPVYNTGRVGPKITYARQRSFRTEELDENGLFNTPLIMAQQRCNTGLDDDEGLEGDTGPKMMKTIHELREAGTNNRFLDDIEELFSDIESGANLGRQRSGYLELALKMRDKVFMGKFRANNFTERLFKNLNQQSDEVICFSLSFILCCLLLEDTTIQTVSQIRSNGSFQMLVRMLDFDQDICLTAKNRKTNMSKAAQGLVQDLRMKVEKSPAFAERKLRVFSGQVMALKVLEESVRELREAGVGDDFLPAEGLSKLVKIMGLFSEIKNTTKVSENFPLELTVSILESYTIGSRVSPELQFSADELGVVANLLPTVAGVKAKGINDILLLTLRFNINLTNNRSYICDKFAESSPSLVPILVYMVRDKFNDLAGLDMEMEERLVQLDLLVLSLGLLINFAELSDMARYAVVGQNTTLLDVLLHIFLGRLEGITEADSVEESHTNVAFGYLSILLGNLCQNSSIRDQIRQKMPKVTLTPLISSLEEFIVHHKKVDDQYEGYAEGPNAAFTERLEQVVKKLKEG